MFKKNLPNQKGFTLLETLIVLAIIALLVSITVPTLSRTLAKQSLASFAHQLAGDIRYVRQRNINGDIHTELKLQITTNEYLLVESVGSAKSTVVVERKRAPAGVSFPHNEIRKTISFSGIGAPNEGGTTIHITNTHGDKYRVTITPATGRVQVFRNQE